MHDNNNRLQTGKQHNNRQSPPLLSRHAVVSVVLLYTRQVKTVALHAKVSNNRVETHLQDTLCSVWLDHRDLKAQMCEQTDRQPISVRLSHLSVTLSVNKQAPRRDQQIKQLRQQ